MPETLGPELLLNPSFEDEVPPLDPGQFETVQRPVGWFAFPGSAPVEIVQSPYFGISSIDGTHWIDSQASPGPIDIGSIFDVRGAKPQTLDVQVAAAWENIGGQTTNPADQLLIKVDGATVLDISMANFVKGGGTLDQPGQVEFNKFHTFNVQVQESAGPHTIQVQDIGPAQNVGIAIDLVGVHVVHGGMAGGGGGMLDSGPA